MEGICSFDGCLYCGCIGVVWMIFELGVIVVLVVMIDMEKIMLVGIIFFKVGCIGVVFGEFFDFSCFVGMEGDCFVFCFIIDEIMYEFLKISG